MNTFGKLAVFALLVLLQVALSVQRPSPRNGGLRQVSCLSKLTIEVQA